MPIRTTWFLLRITSRGRRWRNVAVALGLALGMFVLGLALAAGVGPARSIGARMNQLLPPQRVVVQPRAVEAMWLQFEQGTITPGTVKTVEALSGVRRAGPEATLRFPVSGEVNLLGQAYHSDLTIAGVEPWVLGDDAPDAFYYDPDSDEPVPAVVSQYFLDLYNLGFAASQNLPRFTEAAIIGRQFTLILGKSSFSLEGRDALGQPAEPQVIACAVVGLSQNPELLGLTLPLDAVEAFNEAFSLPEPRYRALHVELESPEDVPRLAAALSEMGLEVRDRMGPWRQALAGARLAGLALLGLGALVFILALAYLASALTFTLAQRRRELALFGALGAAPGQVARLVCLEVGVISAAGIGLGAAGALGLVRFAEHWYAAWRADKLVFPERLFEVPLWAVVLLFIGGWTVAMALTLARLAPRLRRPLVQGLGAPD